MPRTTAAAKSKSKRPEATPGGEAAGSPAEAQPQAPTLTPEARYRMIADAAYFKAEKRGFTGDVVADWLEAEAEIDALSGG